MAHHMRRQIRDAAKEALTGLALTGTRIWSGRISSLKESEMPGLLLFVNADDAIEGANNAGELTADRNGILRVECVAAGGDELIDMLDQIALEVEEALFASAAFEAKLMVPPGPPAANIQIDDAPGGGSKRLGSVILSFPILYRTRLGDPDTQA